MIFDSRALTMMENSELRRRLQEAQDEIKRLQAQVDALMLEYCPDEMTPEQVERWGENQKPAALAAKEGP